MHKVNTTEHNAIALCWSSMMTQDQTVFLNFMDISSVSYFLARYLLCLVSVTNDGRLNRTCEGTDSSSWTWPHCWSLTSCCHYSNKTNVVCLWCGKKKTLVCFFLHTSDWCMCWFKLGWGWGSSFQSSPWSEAKVGKLRMWLKRAHESKTWNGASQLYAPLGAHRSGPRSQCQPHYQRWNCADGNNLHIRSSWFGETLHFWLLSAVNWDWAILSAVRHTMYVLGGTYLCWVQRLLSQTWSRPAVVASLFKTQMDYFDEFFGFFQSWLLFLKCHFRQFFHARLHSSEVHASLPRQIQYSTIKKKKKLPPPSLLRRANDESSKRRVSIFCSNDCLLTSHVCTVAEDMPLAKFQYIT